MNWVPAIICLYRVHKRSFVPEQGINDMDKVIHPQLLCDVVSYPCLGYLILPQYSSYVALPFWPLWTPFNGNSCVTTVRITTTDLCFVDGAVNVSLLSKCCAIIKCDQESSDTFSEEQACGLLQICRRDRYRFSKNRQQDRLTHIGLNLYTVE